MDCKCCECIKETNGHIELIRQVHEEKIKELKDIITIKENTIAILLRSTELSIQENLQIRKRIEGQLWKINSL
jgi:hypothetical protein